MVCFHVSATPNIRSISAGKKLSQFCKLGFILIKIGYVKLVSLSSGVENDQVNMCKSFGQSRNLTIGTVWNNYKRRFMI